VPPSGEERAQLGQEVIAAITLAELKDRLLGRLQEDLPPIEASPIPPQVAAELDVDVVF